MDKENNVSRILSDSITDNNLAVDLIFEIRIYRLIQLCIQKQLHAHSIVQSGIILKIKNKNLVELKVNNSRKK